jgi:hypothetical protein
MSKNPLLLGFEVGKGDSVWIPLKHMAITGQTQEAGKTTALEGLIARSGLRAVTFITKRGESSFTKARRIPPYFREQADWQFVASILEASRSEKLKFERAWIIRASKGADTLADVQKNVRELMEKARGMSADVYLTLDAYLEAVVPQIAKVKWATSVQLKEGVNVVDLTSLNVEMQHLVIKSTITWVLEKEENTIVVVPEAWKFIPQGRGTPVKLAAESFIRQAAAMKNFLWLDSQDIAGVDKIILKSVAVWILGVQREANEIKRTLDNIPDGLPKLKPADISTLELGQFYACWGRHAIKTYVQPTWLEPFDARAVAISGDIEKVKKFEPKKEKTMAYDQEKADLLRENNEQTATILGLQAQIAELLKANRLRDTAEPLERGPKPEHISIEPKGDPPPKAPLGAGQKVQVGPINLQAIERELNITFLQEQRNFKTTGPKGMMMFVLVNDFNNVPAGESEISQAMQERGWIYGHNTLAPELAKLCRDGDLIKEGATRGVKYRVPGKLILTIDGKKV